jgi:ArsR family transcriptional regulator
MATAEPHTRDVQLSLLCKALGNPARVSILRYVLQHPNCIGNQILLHLPEDGPRAQSTLSQHLRLLREVGLLDAYSDGPAVCYRVNSESLGWLQEQLSELRSEK